MAGVPYKTDLLNSTSQQHLCLTCPGHGAPLLPRRLGPLLRDFLHQVLPQDAHELCRGNTHVAVTRLLPYWQTVMVSDFHSRDDLITALLTSCHIPW